MIQQTLRQFFKSVTSIVVTVPGSAVHLLVYPGLPVVCEPGTDRGGGQAGGALRGVIRLSAEGK